MKQASLYLTSLCALCLPLQALGQNLPQAEGAAARPIVRQVETAPITSPRAVAGATPAASPAAVQATPGEQRPRTGDATRSLLSMQARGTAAGPTRPVLGATASAAWNRYLDSFGHPIPQWFEERVTDDSGS